MVFDLMPISYFILFHHEEDRIHPAGLKFLLSVIPERLFAAARYHNAV